MRARVRLTYRRSLRPSKAARAALKMYLYCCISRAPFTFCHPRQLLSCHQLLLTPTPIQPSPDAPHPHSCSVSRFGKGCARIVRSAQRGDSQALPDNALSLSSCFYRPPLPSPLITLTPSPDTGTVSLSLSLSLPSPLSHIPDHSSFRESHLAEYLHLRRLSFMQAVMRRGQGHT